jgi:hypothetical protein
MRIKSSFAGLFVLFVVAGVSYAVTQDQPFMTAARGSLQQAKSELQRAQHNKGGHRANAIQLANQAIAEINKGIAFDRRHNHPQPANVETTTPDQPHMQAALNHLKSARTSLEKATNDKGGHRAKALNLVNQAIDQVNAGIAAAM